LEQLDRLPPDSRYEVLVKLASGGMGTVYIGRRSGVEGFQRLVAIKRADPKLVKDVELRRALAREAELASRIHHSNVVSVIDIEELEDELLLVLEYVDGGSLDAIARASGGRDSWELPADVTVRVVLDAAAGLQAAHTLTDLDGKPLQVVHRDVSPHNILVGLDGVSRIADFGIAHAVASTTTNADRVRGKLGYLAPEYVDTGSFDHRSDLFALGIVLWENLAGRRLFKAASAVEVLRLTLTKAIPPVSSMRPSLGTGFDEVVARALARNPADRFSSALELAEALEEAASKAGLVLSHRSVGRCVEQALGPAVEQRKRALRAGAGVPSSGSGSGAGDAAMRDGEVDAPTATIGARDGFATMTADPGAIVRALTSASAMLPDGEHTGSPVFVPEIARVRSRPRWITGAVIGGVLVAGAAAATAITLRSSRSTRAETELDASSATASATELGGVSLDAGEGTEALSTLPLAESTGVPAAPSASASTHAHRPASAPQPRPVLPKKAPRNPYGH